MITVKYLIVILYSLCLIPGHSMAQENKELNLRQQYVDSLDKIVGINKNEFLKDNDSIVIIHYKGSVYQIHRADKKFKIIQTVLIQKEIKTSESKRAFKTLLKTNEFFIDAESTDKIINAQSFKVLFDLSNAAGDKLVLNFKSMPTNPPNVLDLYTESISKDNYQFRELLAYFLDDIECNGKKLNEVLKDIFLKFNHWEAIENMVKANGFGVYKFSNYDMGISFEYKSNKKYKLDGYPNELTKMPRL